MSAELELGSREEEPSLPPPRRANAPLSVAPANDQLAPETYLISALIDAGTFNPAAYGVAVEDLACWADLYTFALGYQGAAGTAPPLGLVLQRFPDFDYTAGVNPTWAAHQVLREAASRGLRTCMREAINHLNSGDVFAAYGSLTTMPAPAILKPKAADALDPATLTARSEAIGLELPYAKLMDATSGILPGDYWVLSGRGGHGKSWQMLNWIYPMIREGSHCQLFSLEMTRGQVAWRWAHLVAYRKRRDLLPELDSNSPARIHTAVRELSATLPGRLSIIDRELMPRITTDNAYASLADHNVDLTILDHIGLMTTPDGKRSIEDWRQAWLISNVLREHSLSTNGRLLALAQINREGDRTPSGRAPKASQLSQGDIIQMDANVLVTMALAENGRAQVHEAVKVREGPRRLWYTRYDPAHARFEEVDRPTYDDLAAAPG